MGKFYSGKDVVDLIQSAAEHARTRTPGRYAREDFETWAKPGSLGLALMSDDELRICSSLVGEPLFSRKDI